MRSNTLTAIITSVTLFTLVPAVRAQETHNHQHAEQKSEAAHDEHEGHDHTAPHGGALLVLGDEHAAHLELLFEPTTSKLTGYVLDGEAEKAIRIAQQEIRLTVAGGDLKSSAALTLKGIASPLTGEKPGDTSQFEGSEPALKGAKKFNVVIKSITVRGKEYKNVEASYPEGNH